jgi:hypothetical protein
MLTEFEGTLVYLSLVLNVVLILKCLTRKK